MLMWNYNCNQNVSPLNQKSKKKTLSITLKKCVWFQKKLILIQFYLRGENMFWKIEERFIIDRRALILSEKRFPRNPLALLLILFCFWLNPISGLKSNNRWEGKELSLENTQTHFLSSPWSFTVCQSLMSSRFIWEAHHLYIFLFD